MWPISSDESATPYPAACFLLYACMQRKTGSSRRGAKRIRAEILELAPISIGKPSQSLRIAYRLRYAHTAIMAV